MANKISNKFKHIPLGLVALFALAFLPSCWIDTNDCYYVDYLVCENGVEFVQTEYCTTTCDNYYCYDNCVYEDVPYTSEICRLEQRCESVPQCYYDSDCGSNRTCVNGACRAAHSYNPNPGGNGNTGGNGNIGGNTGYCRDFVVCNNNVEFLQSEYCEPMRHPYWNYYYEVCTYQNTPYYSESCRIETRCGYSQAQCVYNSDCPHNRQCVNGQCQHYDLWSGSNGSINSTEIQCNNDVVCQQNGYNVCVYYNGNQVSGVCAKSCLRDSNCPSGYVCEYTDNKISSGVCLNQRFPCRYDSDCGNNGMRCISGSCKVSCMSSYDCQTGNASVSCTNGYCNT